MGKVLGIDYGTKRTGIAITDSSQIIAFGLTTVKTNDLINQLKKILLKEEIDCFVVGNPKNLKGNSTDCSKDVLVFIKKLKKQFPNNPVYLIDERFTSKIAKQSILSCGVKKKVRQNKSLVDRVSATIILQNYIDFS